MAIMNHDRRSRPRCVGNALSCSFRPPIARAVALAVALGVEAGSTERLEAQRADPTDPAPPLMIDELPDPLVMTNGERVTSPQQWPARRAEILQLFEQQVYGVAPPPPDHVPFEVLAEDEALEGRALRRRLRVFLAGDRGGPTLELLLYLPTDAGASVSAFVGLNFRGNHTIEADPRIPISQQWLADQRVRQPDAEPPSEEDIRGRSASRWPLERILSRGYALATAYAGDIDPDYDDGFQNGLHGYFRGDRQTAPGPEEWGTISAWAWGLSRILDVLEQVPEIDAERVAVIGHSRLGKTALWAGARDPRFALTISNNSGCGGAALSRRRQGETVQAINTVFPHWFADNFNAYSDAEATLPVDQHQLIALLAPRPAYIASASEDLWADPEGEFLSALFADPVYRLLGEEGLGGRSAFPAPGEALGDTIGYHLREGRHDITAWDWERYLDFADRHLAAN